jgi:hypothetical protein
MIGKFIAKVKEIGISKTKAGLPQVAVNFVCHYEENGTPKTFEKVGFFSLKGEAAAITLQSLGIMGYKFTVNDLSDIANGSGVDLNKEIEIVIKENTFEGKTTEQVSGVYEVGTAGFQRMNPNEAVALLKGVDVAGTVVSFMQNKGIKAGGEKTAPAEKKQPVADDIPF